MLGNLTLTPDQIDDGNTKLQNAIGVLNRHYWNWDSKTDNYVPSGSYGKQTRVRPPRDIDFIFQLPSDVYHRFQERSGNKQSQLLQEVKEVLAPSNPNTRLRGDGQVVVVPYNTCELEIAPGFLRQGGGYLICDTPNDGRYKWVDPYAEWHALDVADTRANGNVRKLTRILKQWQRYCDVPIKSFHIENLVMETLARLDYAGNDEFWFDWLVRDVLGHMTSRANGAFSMPVTGEIIELGDGWHSKAQSAYASACKACEHEYFNRELDAGDEWQKIFGTMIPRAVT